MSARKKQRKRSDASIEAQYTEIRGNYTPFPRIMLSFFEDHNQAVVWFYLYARDCFSVHTISSISKATGISVRTLPSVLNALARNSWCSKQQIPKKEGTPLYYHDLQNWRARAAFPDNWMGVAKGGVPRDFTTYDRQNYQSSTQIIRNIDKRGIKNIEIPVPNGPMLDTRLTAKDRAFWLWLYIHCQTTPPKNHTLKAIHQKLPHFLNKNITVSALKSCLNKLRKAGYLEESPLRSKRDVRATLCLYKAVSNPPLKIPDGRRVRIEAMQNQDENLRMTEMKNCVVNNKSLVTIGLGLASNLSLPTTSTRMNSSPAAAGLRPDRPSLDSSPGIQGDEPLIPEWVPYRKEGEEVSLRELNRLVQQWQRAAMADVRKAIALYKNEENLSPGAIILWLLEYTHWARLLFDSTMTDYKDYLDDLGAFVLKCSIQFVDWIVQRFNVSKQPFRVIHEIHDSPEFYHPQRIGSWLSKITERICRIVSLCPEMLSEFKEWPKPADGHQIPSWTEDGLRLYLKDQRETHLNASIKHWETGPFDDKGIPCWYGFNSDGIEAYVLGHYLGKIKIPNKQVQEFHQSQNWKELFEYPDLFRYLEEKATDIDYQILFGMKRWQLNALKAEFVRNLVAELMQLRTYGLDLMEYQGGSKK